MIKDMEKLKNQKKITAEALETAKIVRDMESRYRASIELLKLNAMEPLSEEKMMQIRTEYKLISGVWILAELNYETEG